MHQRLGKFEDQRVSAVKGYIHFTPQDKILLSIVLSNTVEERSAAKGVTRIKRGPDAVAERIADVPFQSG
jgi:hypothetical protein